MKFTERSNVKKFVTKSKKIDKDDELANRVYEAAKQPITSDEKREQRVSYILSAVGRSDDETRKEVEQVVKEVYG